MQEIYIYIKRRRAKNKAAKRGKRVTEWFWGAEEIDFRVFKDSSDDNFEYRPNTE